MTGLYINEGQEVQQIRDNRIVRATTDDAEHNVYSIFGGLRTPQIDGINSCLFSKGTPVS